MHDPSEERLDYAIPQLNKSAVDLLVSVGMMASVIDRLPDEVISNFAEKVEMTTNTLTRIAEEFTAFGEAFDDD